jgi:hypothetical protein
MARKFLEADWITSAAAASQVTHLARVHCTWWVGGWVTCCCCCSTASGHHSVYGQQKVPASAQQGIHLPVPQPMLRTPGHTSSTCYRNHLGTATGRLSCQDPNLQAVGMSRWVGGWGCNAMLGRQASGTQLASVGPTVACMTGTAATAPPAAGHLPGCLPGPPCCQVTKEEVEFGGARVRVRDAFVAAPGHVLISADYSQVGHQGVREGGYITLLVGKHRHMCPVLPAPLLRGTQGLPQIHGTQFQGTLVRSHTAAPLPHMRCSCRWSCDCSPTWPR